MPQTVGDVTSQGLADIGKVMTDTAYARTTNAQAQHLETENLIQQRFLQRLGGMGQGAATGNEPLDPVDQLMMMGRMYTEAGDPKTGAGILDKAFSIRYKQAARLNQQALKEGHDFDNQQKELEQKLQLLAGVNDESSWEAYKQVIGRENDPTPYDPAKVMLLRETGLKLKDQLALKEKTRMDNQLFKLRDIQMKLEDARRRRTEQLIKEGPKAGTKDTRIPPAAFAKDSLALLKRDFPDAALDPYEQAALQVAANEIADNANQLFRNNPALSPTEAMNQAYIIAAKTGKLKLFTPAAPAKKEAAPGYAPPGAPNIPDDIVPLGEEEIGVDKGDVDYSGSD